MRSRVSSEPERREFRNGIYVGHAGKPGDDAEYAENGVQSTQRVLIAVRAVTGSLFNTPGRSGFAPSDLGNTIC